MDSDYFFLESSIKKNFKTNKMNKNNCAINDK